MEKSPPSGKALSATGETDCSALSALKDISHSSLLEPIHKALGPEGELHLVGGTVRDILCGQQHYDIDLASSFRPERSEALLIERGLRVVRTGIEHGTLTVVVDGNNIELTTFRKPGPRNSGLFSDSIIEDLTGRDFTINAIAFALDNELLVDPHGGARHLQQKILQAVGAAHERFVEDPLRILRMIRFGPSQNRQPAQALLDAAAAHKELLQQVSVERIRTELLRILLCPNPRAAFQVMLQLGLVDILIPEMLPAVAFEQNEFHTEDVFEHTLSVLERCPPNALVRLAALFHDLGKPHTLSTDEEQRRHFYNHEKISGEILQTVMKRLKFSNEEIKGTSTIVGCHMRPLTCGPPGLRRLMRDLGPYMEEWLQLKAADVPPTMEQKEFEAQRQHFEALLAEEELRLQEPAYGKLAINGHDLIALGMKPGPQLGRILGQLEELVLDDPELNEPKVLLHKAREILKMECSL